MCCEVPYICPTSQQEIGHSTRNGVKDWASSWLLGEALRFCWKKNKGFDFGMNRFENGWNLKFFNLYLIDNMKYDMSVVGYWLVITR